MRWVIKRTDSFLASFQQMRSNKKVVGELGKKIKRLEKDPLHTGGWLSGSLHGKKSTRIAQRYRLIFLPDEQAHVVYLVAIDHRKNVYT